MLSGSAKARWECNIDVDERWARYLHMKWCGNLRSNQLLEHEDGWKFFLLRCFPLLDQELVEER